MIRRTAFLFTLSVLGTSNLRAQEIVFPSPQTTILTELTEKERLEFSTRFLDVLRAVESGFVDAGVGTCSVWSEARLSPEFFAKFPEEEKKKAEPEVRAITPQWLLQSIGTKATLVPFGLAPETPMTIALQCGQLKDIQVTLHIDPIVAEVETSDDVTAENGIGWRLETTARGDAVEQTLGVGEFLTAEQAEHWVPPTRRPHLAAPRSIQVHLVAKAPQKLNKLVQMQAVAKVLQTKWSSPELSSESLQEGVPLTPEKRTELEASVYRFVLAPVAIMGNLPIAPETVSPRIRPDSLTELAALLQEIPRSALDNYNIESKKRGTVPTLPDLAAVVMLSEKEVSSCLGKKASKAGWKKLEERFGFARINSLSRVGFSPGGRFAVVSTVMDWQEPDISTGKLYRRTFTSVHFLEREGESWHKLYELTVQ